MKQSIIESNFAVDEKVAVLNGIYKDKEGVVSRLGSAGEVIFVHVQLYNVNTIICFTERQLRKC